jgi:RNA polymerase sigma-70 factor (ECF subfamily)
MEIQTSLSSLDESFTEVNEKKIGKLKSCLQKLPEESKSLMMARYFNSETVTSLAERLLSSENAISSKIFRLKKKLKTCIESS